MPVGNAAGDLVTSWLNPTSIVLGGIAVATAAYLAAVYLAADAAAHRPARARARVPQACARHGRRRRRARPLAGLVVVHSDAEPIWDGLTSGAGLAAVIVSALAGAGTIVFVLRRRYEPARFTAADRRRGDHRRLGLRATTAVPAGPHDPGGRRRPLGR